MILEILSSSLLAATVYLVNRIFFNGACSQKREPLPRGELRELGNCESFFHSNFKTNSYLKSFNIIVNSQIHMDGCKVEEALQILAKRHPLLQAAIREVRHTDGKTYHFTKMSSFRIDYEQSNKEAREPSHWHDVMTKDLLKPINDQEGPLWRCCQLKECIDIGSCQITNCFVFTFHHAIIDGSSMTMLFEEFLSILHRLHKIESVLETSYNVRPSREALLADMIRPEWWRIIVIKVLEIMVELGLYSLGSTKIDVYFNKYPVIRNVCPDIKPENRAIFTCFSKSETQKFLRACKEHACTVNGALTAAANMAMADILQDDGAYKGQWIPSKYSIDCRRDINVEENNNADYLGLYIVGSKLNCYVPCYDLQSFSRIFWKAATEITGHVRKTIKTKSHLQEIKRSQCFSLSFIERGLSSDVYEHHGRRMGDILFGISNIGRFFDVSNQNCLFNVDKMFICSAGHKRGSLFKIFFITVNEKLCCSFTYFPHVTAKCQAEEFNTKFLQNLRRVFKES